MSLAKSFVSSHAKKVVSNFDFGAKANTIAGLPVTSGGKVVLSGFAKEMALVRPYGMVVDNAKNILYVADSGNSRVLGINLSSLYAQVVAGDGTCTPTIKDNIPATSVKFHALRACFATQLLSKNVPPAIVMKICGWKNLKTMEFYVRLAGVNESGATEVLNILPTEREVMDNVVKLFS